jgi:hypothetical protein
MNTKIANALNHKSTDLESAIEQAINERDEARLDRDINKLECMIRHHQLKQEQQKDHRYAR